MAPIRIIRLRRTYVFTLDWQRARTLHVRAYSPFDGQDDISQNSFRVQTAVFDRRSFASFSNQRALSYDFRTFSVDVANRNGDNFAR